MDYPYYGGYGFSEDQHQSNSGLWRNGPAKLFFDRAGIPEDGNIEYGSVYHLISLNNLNEEDSDEEAEASQGVAGDGGADDRATSRTTNGGEEVTDPGTKKRWRDVEQDELENAVKTILIQDSFCENGAGTDAKRLKMLVDNHATDPNLSSVDAEDENRLTVDVDVREENLPKSVPELQPSIQPYPWSTLDDIFSKESNTSSNLATGPAEVDFITKHVSQAESDAAVNALLIQMRKDKQKETLPGTNSEGPLNVDNYPILKSLIEEPDEDCLVMQKEWEKDVIWTPDDGKVDEAAAKVKQAYAGWIPNLTKRKFHIEEEDLNGGSCSQTDKDYSEDHNFKSLFPIENDVLVKGDWENDVIWDVDDFLYQCPQPKVPILDANDDQLVLEKPKDIPKFRLRTGNSSRGGNASSPTKSSSGTAGSPKKVIQPHAIKSKLLLGKAGFIQWKWQMEQELKAKEQQDLLEKDKGKSRSSTSTSTGPVGASSDKLKQELSINFNLSNDEFYLPNPKDTGPGGDMLKLCSLNYIRHSKVVLDLLPPFMATYLSENELKNFHRPQFKDSSNIPKFPNVCKFQSYYQQKIRKAKEREALLKDGHQVLLDRPSDLTGLDGEMVLVENSEEYPPLLSQVGMCSKIINYYKRKSLKDRYAHGVPHPYGETTFVYGLSSPFLGTLDPGQVLSALENNMYRAPIYKHSNPSTDFIMIFNKNGAFIREYDSIFTSGQQCPLIEVPEPNSPRAKTFLKNLVLVYVYRKFSKYPPGSTARIRLNEIFKSFPGIFESTLKTWLKNCAEIKKIGTVSWVVMKEGFVIPDENELKEMVTPEQCCAYYSHLAGEQRLKDAGCNSLLSLPERAEGSAEDPSSMITSMDHKKSFSSSNDIHEQMNNQSKLMEELKCAPWNTTSSFVAVSRGKCFLQITGPADPTGRGEGFSYIRVGKKGSSGQGSSLELGRKQQFSKNNKLANLTLRPGGTDADLRKLSSKNAKELLKRAGLPDKEISKLHRWELIDVVRTLSTERARLGEKDDKGIAKFSRWKSKTNSLMNFERYREDCQRVFQLQNKVLSSAEPLTTDDEDEEDEENEVNAPTEEDIHEMGRNLERILREGKTASELFHEEEELERLELQKMMLGTIQPKDADFAKKAAQQKKKFDLEQENKKKDEDFLAELINNPNRKLKISRTFKDNGKSFLRTEIVRDPVIIAAYLKIRTTKSEEFIKDFLQKADRQRKKEERLKEKMLRDELQEKKSLQNSIVEKFHRKRKREIETEYFPNKAAKDKAEKELSKVRRRCGACGMLGHTRTNPKCPMNNPEKMKMMEEQKVQKRGRGRPPLKRGPQGTVPPISIVFKPTGGAFTKPSSASSSNSPSPLKLKFNNNHKLTPIRNLNLSKIPTSKGNHNQQVPRTSTYSQSQGKSHSQPEQRMSLKQQLGLDCTSDEDSSSSSSEDERDRQDDSSSSSSESSNKSEELVEDQTMVKVDGLKMVLRVPQDMITKAQIEEQEEEEAARILLSMSNPNFARGISSGPVGSQGGGGPPKRRSSQAEREHADYLNERKYKTTAADRIRKKDP